MISCQNYEDQMIAYVKGDLQALEQERMEAHLRRCRGCEGLRSKVDGGFKAAATWNPKIDADHMARLVHRLSPLMHETPRRRFEWGFFAVAMGAAAAALLAWVVLQKGPSSESIPVQKPGLLPVAKAPMAAPAEPNQAVPNLRITSSPDWDGKVFNAPSKTPSIRMSKGFALMDYETTDEALLRVKLDHIDADIQGRVFVEVTDVSLRTIGVLSGRAMITVGDRTEILTAGTVQSYDRLGRRTATPDELKAIDHVAPEELLTPTPRSGEDGASQDKEASKGPSSIRPKSGPKPRRLEPAVTLMNRAEKLARNKRFSRALRLYRKVWKSTRRRDAPYRELARFEMARVYGFQLGRQIRARRIFTKLARARSAEVRTQAKFALCELDIGDAPCVAAAWLQSIIADAQTSPGVRNEARKLIKKWKLANLTCEQ